MVAAIARPSPRMVRTSPISSLDAYSSLSIELNSSVVVLKNLRQRTATGDEEEEVEGKDEASDGVGDGSPVVGVAPKGAPSVPVLVRVAGQDPNL